MRKKMTFRGREGPGDPDAYWRRRFFILAGGLAVLMLAAWLSGGGGPSRQASRAAAVQASAAASQARQSLPSAALGTPSVSPSPSASPTPSFPVPGSTASATPSASGSATAAGSGPGARCPAGSIVLSLFTSQPGYRPAQQPKFNIYAVSTSASACQLKYGPAAVRVVVTRHGKVVWDSAACTTTSRGAKMVSLTRGVPQEVTLTWDRKASGQRCAGMLPPTEWGTYVAVAQADGRTSPVRSFKLLRR